MIGNSTAADQQVRIQQNYYKCFDYFLFGKEVKNANKLNSAKPSGAVGR
jgi:hypothetical protein